MYTDCSYHHISTDPPADKTAKSPNMRRLILLLALMSAPLVTGCSSLSHLRTSDRYKKGYIIVLPGVEGRGRLNTNIAKGLERGGVPSAIEVYDWTAFRFFSLVINLRAMERNKREAKKIAKKIVSYQDRYPGRPVHLVGHSGGGCIAVLALEALPHYRKIQSAILLAPAITPDYYLGRALKRTQHGIWNYYSRRDVFFLRFGTTIMGTVDGRHTTAAGAVGFALPWGLDKQDRRLYGAKLHQQQYTPQMAKSGHIGTHIGWANRKFVAEWLAPIINSQIDKMSTPTTKPHQRTK
ncbi:MAG: alpha/beta fold hydrolase [Planctomycetota bacterium]|nr:MAG: alpha/beta fold hydrolase [Planctomycetota bacterium]